MSLFQVKQVQPHDGFVFFANLLFFVFARLIYLDWFYLRFLSSKLVTQMTQVADGTVARGLGRSVCQAAWQVCLPSIPACLLLPRSRMAHVTSFPGQMSLEGSPVHNLAMAMTWPRYAMVCNHGMTMGKPGYRDVFRHTSMHLRQ